MIKILEKPTADSPATLFINECGPYLSYSKDDFQIHDLNPQVDIRWKISK